MVNCNILPLWVASIYFTILVELARAIYEMGAVKFSFWLSLLILHALQKKEIMKQELSTLFAIA